MAGKTYPRDAVFITVWIGSAGSIEHGDFELLTGLNGAPIIRNLKTGKSWAIGWQELIEMAVDAGVANAEAPDAA